MFTFDIRVRANSSQNKVGGTAGEPPRLIVAVQAPAVDGKANEAVLKTLAKTFDVRARDCAIISGEISRDKRVQIVGAEVTLAEKYSDLISNHH